MSDFNRDKCFKTMLKLIDEIKDNVKDTIYHYTKSEGFEGIIKSKEIWMTNALFVNDTTELRIPLEGDVLFKDVQFKNPESFDVFKMKQEIFDPKEIKNRYLVSFSEDGNSLGQFRAYGNYCIGFDAEKLKRNRFFLVKCVYNKSGIKKWIIRKDNLAGWQNECFDNRKGPSYKRGAFSHVPFGVIAKLKNKHYKSEKEVRLLAGSYSSWGHGYLSEMYYDQPAIYFRKDNMFNAPVPYIKFFIPKRLEAIEELIERVKGKSQLETKQIIRNMEMEQEKELLPIKEVRIGPMPHQKEVVLATKMFLLENGYETVDVIPSDIPFRGII